MARLTFHLIPHTHWDREWYLTRTGFQARLVPVMDELLDRLDQDSEARFVLDGQTVLLEDYLEVRPEAEARIGAAVRRGALEVGPWYVLADLLIPMGESLVRNLLEGSRDAWRFGRRTDVLYSPDAFGHPSALPTLAEGFGIRRAAVRRGLGRPLGLDRDLYRWAAAGKGGESCLTYHFPNDGYEVAIRLAYLLNLDEANEEFDQEWRRIRRQLVARAVTTHIAVFLGADHHPLVPDLELLRRRIQTLEPDHVVRISGLGRFFQALEESRPKVVPAIRGELRRIDGHTWVLQDVHSTRSRLTRRQSLAELTLTRLTEPLAAMAQWQAGLERSELLRYAWRRLLQSQFHDTLSGSCCDDVAREQEVRLEGVETLNRQIATDALWKLAGYDPDASRESSEPVAPRLVLWNPAARSRSGILTAELTVFRGEVLVGPPAGRVARVNDREAPVALTTSAGESVSLQVLGRRSDTERVDARRHHPRQDEVERVFVALRSPLVAGLGMDVLAPGRPRRSRVREVVEVGDRSLANRYVRLRLTSGGKITLDDKRTGERFSGLCAVEDESDRGDTYTHSPVPGVHPVRQVRQVSHAVLAPGALVGAVETKYTLVSAGGGEGHLEIRLVVVLHADSPIVRLRFDIGNHATDHRLRVRFPVGAGEAALAGAAFGTERRPPLGPAPTGVSLERPVATAPAHQFVAATSDRRGLAVLAPGFLEYEWTSGLDLLVTLLRGVGELSRGDLPERPGHAAWPQATPLAQEQGMHVVQLGLLPIGSLAEGRPDRLREAWEDVFLPVQAAYLRHAISELPGPDDLRFGATLEGEGLVLSAVKPSESDAGVVLRCYNDTETEVLGRWVFPSTCSLSEAMLVRADESPLRRLALADEGYAVQFTAGPHELVTIRVQ